MKKGIQHKIFVFCSLLSFVILPITVYTQSQEAVSNISAFRSGLQQICGKAFEGAITHSAAGDTMFNNKRLLMHVSFCDSNVMRIPFFVGEDSSRTWILTFHEDFIQLKHDHRKPDGSEDRITQYGGASTNFGNSMRQVFPADQQTADLLPAAASNVWWIELVPDSHFSYNLRRIGTDRLFSVTFDLTQPVDSPGAPWGW